MQIVSIIAEVKPGDPGPGDVHPDYAEVIVDLGDRQVTFVIHQSKVYSDTLNVEVDGSLLPHPKLRVNVNDCLVFDSVRNLPPLDDNDSGDLDGE